MLHFELNGGAPSAELVRLAAENVSAFRFQIVPSGTPAPQRFAGTCLNRENLEAFLLLLAENGELS